MISADPLDHVAALLAAAATAGALPVRTLYTATARAALVAQRERVGHLALLLDGHEAELARLAKGGTQ
jgi:hypothetical protein